MKPLIGLILDEHEGEAGGFSSRPFFALRQDYFSAIERAGGLPLGLGYGREAFEAALEVCDGFLIPGADYRFSPDWYREAPPPDLMRNSARGAFEAWAVARLLAQPKPILGVCNGMQVMAGVRGGAMAFRPDPPQAKIRHGRAEGVIAEHEITIEAGTRLAALLGVEPRRVNSAHREQVVDAGDLIVAARAQDGVIEALEVRDHPFAIGVQWHPELLADDPLIAALVAAAAKRSGLP